MKLLIVTLALAQRGTVHSLSLSTVTTIAASLPRVLTFAVYSPRIRMGVKPALLHLYSPRACRNQRARHGLH
jgi:hypothetical protein